MMPVIRISDATFSDLATLAKWFESKTPSQAIDKIVREAMDSLDLEREINEEAMVGDILKPNIKFTETPGLSFTKILKASVDGKKQQRPKWNGLIVEILRSMKKRGMSPEELVDALSIPAMLGQFEENGFKYYPELGISVQGQSAQDAWKEIQRISPKWKISVEVSFEWRENPKAQHPGLKGELRS